LTPGTPGAEASQAQPSQPDIAVVTGAGRGIGKAIALAFADLGHTVVIAARSEAELQAVAREIGARGARAVVVAADVAQEAGLARIVAAAKACAGQVAVLVNNAGVSPKPRAGRRTPFLEMSMQEWNDVMATNLTSAFVLSRDLGAVMCAAGRGSIVNIASVAVRVGALTGGAHYVASKAGMVGLTKAIAREFAPHGVRVNAVAPGRIATAMTEVANRSIEPGWPGHTIPLGREGDVREIAGVVTFLASPQASYITGCTLDVTGGWTMT
jgi:3-oxoacyl-[acyl-carrier protein] reductase